jgi:uncharacterized protein (DUF433 family)
MDGEPIIIEQGRGPTIAGTRTTVYHILDYHLLGWSPATIAIFLRLSTDQVLAALDYIDANRARVDEEYQKMLKRAEEGNPPEVRAKLDAAAAKLRAAMEARHGGAARGS